jgi:CheY-like chemotaxis protein
MSLKYSIYIVDDDADDRDSIRDAFLHNNHQPEFVFLKNGDELINQLSKPDAFLPSLILLDLNMPGKDGRTALKEIKSNPTMHHIPVIILTTSSLHKDKQTAYNLGANCFVTKPDTFNRFIALTDSIAKLWLSS